MPILVERYSGGHDITCSNEGLSHADESPQQTHEPRDAFNVQHVVSMSAGQLVNGNVMAENFSGFV